LTQNQGSSPLAVQVANQVANQVALSGIVVELDTLRYTPAGIPVLRFRIAHESEQSEAGTARKVGCEIAAVAFDREARLAAGLALGANVTLRGFLERKGRDNRALVLHATHIAFE
jgi:primosomal replication protein N